MNVIEKIKSKIVPSNNRTCIEASILQKFVPREESKLEFIN